MSDISLIDSFCIIFFKNGIENHTLILLIDSCLFQSGDTPLHIAARGQKYNSIRFLIDSSEIDKYTILKEENQASFCGFYNQFDALKIVYRRLICS